MLPSSREVCLFAGLEPITGALEWSGLLEWPVAFTCLINPRRVGGGLQYLVGLCVCLSVCLSVCYHKIAV